MKPQEISNILLDQVSLQAHNLPRHVDTMNQSDHQRAEQIFTAAIEIADLTARRVYLDRAYAGDESLRQEVESLLAASAQAGTFMDQPPAALWRAWIWSRLTKQADRSWSR